MLNVASGIDELLTEPNCKRLTPIDISLAARLAYPLEAWILLLDDIRQLETDLGDVLRCLISASITALLGRRQMLFSHLPKSARHLSGFDQRGTNALGVLIKISITHGRHGTHRLFTRGLGDDLPLNLRRLLCATQSAVVSPTQLG